MTCSVCYSSGTINTTLKSNKRNPPNIAKLKINKKTAYLNRYNAQYTRKLSLKSLKEDKKPNAINLPLCSCVQARAAPWRRLGCTEETRANFTIFAIITLRSSSFLFQQSMVGVL